MKMRFFALMAILVIIAVAVPASAHQRNRRDNRGNHSRVDRNRDYGYSRGNSHVNRNRNGHYNRYSRPATRADVRGWNGAVVGVVALSTVISEVRAERRHDEQMAAMGELRDRRQQRQSEAPRASEARGYYGAIQSPPASVTAPAQAPVRNRPAQFKVINGTPDIICVEGKTLNPHSSDRATVSDPANIEISAPDGGTICPTDAEYISADTIMVVCASPKGR